MNTVNLVIIGMFALIAIISVVVVFRNGTGNLTKDGKLKSGYFEDDNGNKSSTRLKSYLMMFFFFVINMMVFASVLSDHSLVTGTGGLQFLFLFLVFDALILTAIFVPSQLAKTSEVTAMIELAKPSAVKQTEAETKQIEAEKQPDKSTV